MPTTHSSASSYATFRRQLAAGSMTAGSGTHIRVGRRHTTTDAFHNRHIGPSSAQTEDMLKLVGYPTLQAMMSSILPSSIVRAGAPVDGAAPKAEGSSPADGSMAHAAPLSETQALKHFSAMMGRNKVLKSLIGHGYYEAITPPVILRNILENPGWYTPYTPYQAEISQGRLESLLNYQTVITELTGMEIANASLLDQATAASESMFLAFQAHKKKRNTFFVSSTCFPSTIEMLRSRAAPLKINVVVGDIRKDLDLENPDLCGILTQTPDATGAIHDFTDLFAKAKTNKVLSCVSTDLLASCIVKSVGSMGADVAVGSAQRFGIPLGFGGPHAAFFAVNKEFQRSMPGRIVGVSKDTEGNTAIRLALQTREQHIKREKATSNVCTAQALLANMSAMYAIYHGPVGLKEIAEQVRQHTATLALGLETAEATVLTKAFFDTLTFKLNGMTADEYVARCLEKGINVFHDKASQTVSVSIDEATTEQHISALLEAAGMENPKIAEIAQLAKASKQLPPALRREGSFLQHPTFNMYQTESELMRYIHRLQRKDYGLTHGMIPLGSCTMKLNPAATMLPMSWPTVGNIHPMVPESQCRGYEAMCIDLSQKLKEVTGLAAVSLQPNSGAQGEYAGLRCISAYHQSKGEGHRNVCLVPMSAHGTNPDSAMLCGMEIVVVACTKEGPIDLVDLEAKIEKYKKDLSCIMITYPSTYGLFDKDVKKITSMIHAAGGQVYFDGANLNALVGYSGPKFVGGDVCHMNLHKTFSIPHGGGGPGMGPIAVAEHLAPFLPNAVYGAKVGGSQPFGQVSQAAHGSASILTISYMLMLMLGSEGLAACTAYAILNANYLKRRLDSSYSVLYKDENGNCGHEFIIDIKPFKKTAGIEAEDVAKRLMDYGFHAPTLAFPVVGTLMIEPTESESKAELDRFADALISIRQEIANIESGVWPKDNNPLTNAPHTMSTVTKEAWDRPYSREVAAFPSPHTKIDKYWPTVSRVDGAYGDRNLMCSCAGVEAFAKSD